jgi:hypothetical protein
VRDFILEIVGVFLELAHSEFSSIFCNYLNFLVSFSLLLESQFISPQWLILEAKLA